MPSHAVSMSTAPLRTSLRWARTTDFAAPVSAAVSSCSLSSIRPACRNPSHAPDTICVTAPTLVGRRVALTLG